MFFHAIELFWGALLKVFYPMLNHYIVLWKRRNGRFLIGSGVTFSGDESKDGTLWHEGSKSDDDSI